MRSLLVAVAATLVVMPVTATASTASFRNSALYLTGEGTENNDFRVAVVNEPVHGIRVEDRGVARMTPSESCLPVALDALLCPTVVAVPQISQVIANLGAGDDTLVRSAGTAGARFTVTGGAGADRIEMWDQDDWVDPGAGPDTVDGGGGLNLLYLRGDAAGIVANGDAGKVTHAGSTDIVQGISQLVAGSGNDHLSGFKVVEGGGGDDVIVGAASGSRIHGEAGNDVISGGPGPDTVDGGGGADAMSGGGGEDLVTYEVRGPGVFIHQNGLADDGEAGEGDHVGQFEILRGAVGDDVLMGGGGARVLEGMAGADRLLGDVTGEVLRGGHDDDYLDGGLGADLLDCGFGTDQYVNRDVDELRACEIDAG